MKHIIAFLLHHANRCAKDFAWGKFLQDFYRVKDAILKKYGTHIYYDVQHIKGKRCNSCGGTGYHTKYSWHYPYKAYDWDGCWHCGGNGWYKDPIWICLSVIKFGKYTFHKPLKKEYSVKNPFTKEQLGWDVTERSVIEGYIDHTESWFGRYALLLIMWRTPDRNMIAKRILKEWKWWMERKAHKMKKLFYKQHPRPIFQVEQGESDWELPF